MYAIYKNKQKQKNCKTYFKSLLFVALKSDIEVGWAILTIPGKRFYTWWMISTIRSNKCIIYTCCTILCKIGIVNLFGVVEHYGMWFLWEWIIRGGTVRNWYNRFLDIWGACKGLTGMFFFGRFCTELIFWFSKFRHVFQFLIYIVDWVVFLMDGFDMIGVILDMFFCNLFWENADILRWLLVILGIIFV